MAWTITGTLSSTIWSNTADAGLCRGLFFLTGRNIIIIPYKAHHYLNVLSMVQISGISLGITDLNDRGE
jgi:hypothetical protein